MKIKYQPLLLLAFLFACQAKPHPNRDAETALTRESQNAFSKSADRDRCEQWLNQKVSLAEYLSACEPCSQEDCFRQFENLPCVQSGNMINPNQDTATYEINAGGWIRITQGDSVRYWCAKPEKGNAYFLSLPAE